MAQDTLDGDVVAGAAIEVELGRDVPEQMYVNLEAGVTEHALLDLHCQGRRRLRLAVLAGEQRRRRAMQKAREVLTDIPGQQGGYVVRQLEVDRVRIFDLVLRHHEVEFAVALDEMALDIEVDEIAQAQR